MSAAEGGAWRDPAPFGWFTFTGVEARCTALDRRSGADRRGNLQLPADDQRRIPRPCNNAFIKFAPPVVVWVRVQQSYYLPPTGDHPVGVHRCNKCGAWLEVKIVYVAAVAGRRLAQTAADR